MTKRINAALISIVAVAVVFMSAGSSAVSAGYGGRHQQGQSQAAQRTHKRAHGTGQRARSRSRAKRRAVLYVCPMHPDIRQRSRGTCPKCLMDLVAEPRGSKASGTSGGR